MSDTVQIWLDPFFDSDCGGIVTCLLNDILPFVAPLEFDAELASDVAVGLLGRSLRRQDANERVIIHIEDRRV